MLHQTFSANLNVGFWIFRLSRVLCEQWPREADQKKCRDSGANFHLHGHPETMVLLQIQTLLAISYNKFLRQQKYIEPINEKRRPIVNELCQERTGDWRERDGT